VNVAVATPDAFVVTVIVFDELENVPLAPDPLGAVKTTEAPLTGLPPEVTVAANWLVNAVLIDAL
jgi:hypothetical protein